LLVQHETKIDIDRRTSCERCHALHVAFAYEIGKFVFIRNVLNTANSSFENSNIVGHKP
jgi:hypothetical protein